MAGHREGLLDGAMLLEGFGVVVHRVIEMVIGSTMVSKAELRDLRAICTRAGSTRWLRPDRRALGIRAGR